MSSAIAPASLLELIKLLDVVRPLQLDQFLSPENVLLDFANGHG
jgi:hypothetical protein